VDAVEFDLHSVTHYLQEGGLTDEEIIDTTIELSDLHPRYDENVAGYILGEYNHAERKAIVYANHLAFDAYVSVPGAEEKLSEEVNNTLVHELEHRVASLDEEQWAENVRYARDHANFRLLMYAGAASVGAVTANTGSGMTAAASLAVGAIAPLPGMRKLLNRRSVRRGHYLRHPEEVRCRLAADAYPRDLVFVSSNELDVSGITTLDAFNELIFELGEQYAANADEREEQVREEVLAAANAQQMEMFNKWLTTIIRGPYFRA
jgi:hypothetical protein